MDIIIINLLFVVIILGAIHAAGYRLRHKHYLGEERNKIIARTRAEMKVETNWKLVEKDNEIKLLVDENARLTKNLELSNINFLTEKNRIENLLDQLIKEVGKDHFLKSNRTKKDIAAAFIKHLQGIIESVEMSP